ncbi:hypothetical protein EJ08DRAFT_396044 [Tothia fuscella]|uniref:Uncharacterized protein n=1 Tax=Tothia fuscella TaxID=1048955 RepID=A0A9P4NKF0_9PEZI|nr:hypothetical protein EJ08DRAFT_396044 [Tothia fuscella]
MVRLTAYLGNLGNCSGFREGFGRGWGRRRWDNPISIIIITSISEPGERTHAYFSSIIQHQRLLIGARKPQGDTPRPNPISHATPLSSYLPALRLGSCCIFFHVFGGDVKSFSMIRLADAGASCDALCFCFWWYQNCMSPNRMVKWAGEDWLR